jgi:F-type H+-transporting ATPase subunit epsilon
LGSYNRYIAVASRVVRRSLKEDKRIAAERRGESELRFAKWEVSAQHMRGSSGMMRWHGTEG